MHTTSGYCICFYPTSSEGSLYHASYLVFRYDCYYTVNITSVFLHYLEVLESATKYRGSSSTPTLADVGIP